MDGKPGIRDSGEKAGDIVLCFAMPNQKDVHGHKQICEKSQEGRRRAKMKVDRKEVELRRNYFPGRQIIVEGN